MHVLIVEDEISLAKEMDSFLSQSGYRCDLCPTGKEASEKLFVNQYDFILLDLGLPDYDGLDLLKEAKETNTDAAFIILTARSSTNDKINGLNLGADDYLAKPFSLPELHSRMQAILRRKHGLNRNTIKMGGFEMDILNRTFKFQAHPINLTKKEFDILHYLILNKNKVITRIQLTEHLWGDILEDDYESNYIDVHMKNIRKKLSAHSDPTWLETVRGIGYRINQA
jgi:DNA-binding response OmpR family regulator